MIIKSLTPWFGGKRTLAPAIIEQLGAHTQYFEPFCGSMAVLLAKKPSQKETVNDLHGDVINLARVAADPAAAPALYERLQSAFVCEHTLQEARGQLAAVCLDPATLNASPASRQHVERAYWYFLACWMGRNGTAGSKRVDYQIAVRWTKNGGSPSVRWRNAVDSLPAWHRRLQNVVILNRDAFGFLDRFEDVPGTAIYVDPPYIAESRSGFRHGPGSDHKYLHEFSHSRGDGGLFQEEHPDDHARLVAILSTYTKARVVVSYYDCPRVRDLYSGWTFLEKRMQKHLHAQGGRGARPMDAPELLIINGPAYGTK